MSRLIDADAFLKRNEVYEDCEFNHPKYQDTLREIIEAEPSVDAVEVVRCKYCVYCRKEDDFEYWCEGFCNPPRLVSMNDFFSHGKFRCENKMCGCCENGKCFNESHVRVKHNCRYGKENADADS